MISSASYPTWRPDTLFAERQMREGIVSLSELKDAYRLLNSVKDIFFLNKIGLFDTFDLINI